jgi:hypothetical protein
MKLKEQSHSDTRSCLLIFEKLHNHKSNCTSQIMKDGRECPRQKHLPPYSAICIQHFVYSQKVYLPVPNLNKAGMRLRITASELSL